MKKNRVIDISKTTFISVCLILLALIGLSVALTYLIPRGEFAMGETGADYGSYISHPDLSGLPLWKGLLAPVLILGSEDGLSLIMLSLFLLVVSGSFQVLIDSRGISHLVRGLAAGLGKNRRGLVLVLALVFMIFGAFFGLFEETLPMVPLVLMLCLGVGYDGFTAFLVSVGSACLGFAAGITNPFTVVLASELIGTSVAGGILFRCLVFVVMFGLNGAFLLRHLRKIEKDPRLSPTFEADEGRRRDLQELPEEAGGKRLSFCTLGLLFAALAVTLLFSLSSSLRGYTVPAVAGIYLMGTLLFGIFSGFRPGPSLKSFGRGALSALPAVLFVLLASSVKYILMEGHVLATIAQGINGAVAGSSRLTVAYILLGIILVLEFFISSSTAKAIFVMGILSCLTVPLSKPLLVMIYLFGDGYTNLFFPTSPVLWIGLSMIGMGYGKWLKKSAPLWIGILILTAGLLGLAVLLEPIR
ncbi:MAG: hypothetical protein J6H18_02175 [Lachnospiraceae bacterium]|nr:hypothetical protein [Lachnospiraceae bacterium]